MYAKKTNRSLWIPHVIFIILLGLSGTHFYSNIANIKEDTYKTIELRASVAQHHLKMFAAKNSALKEAFVQNYYLARDGKLSNDLFSQIKHNPLYDTYTLTPLDGSPVLQEGTLTSPVKLDPNDKELRYELMAALSLDAQLKAINQHVPMSIWEYYTSKKGFLYLSPVHKIADFQFKTEFYKRPFWEDAIPSANPERKQIFTELYKDEAGKGLIMTISDPIYIDDIFKGTISIDIDNEGLKKLFELDHVSGKSFLVDENKRINASNIEYEVGERVNIPSLDVARGWLAQSGSLYCVIPIVEDQLYMVHMVSNKGIYISAFFASLVIMGMLVTIGIVIYFSYFIFQSAQRNKLLMQRDPLTNLYNRRGFYALLEPMLAYLKRHEKMCAVMMVDLDDLKKLNDTHGHKAGDFVIERIAETLLEINRKDTVCARWGGDEFLVFIPEVNRQVAYAIAKRIHKQVMDKQYTSKNINATVSIGVVTSKIEDGFEELLSKADVALYQAKKAGKNTINIV